MKHPLSMILFISFHFYLFYLRLFASFLPKTTNQQSIIQATVSSTARCSRGVALVALGHCLPPLLISIHYYLTSWPKISCSSLAGGLLPSHLFLYKHHRPLNLVVIVAPFHVATCHLYHACGGKTPAQVSSCQSLGQAWGPCLTSTTREYD